MNQKTITISNQTKEKVEAAKIFIQQRYSRLIQQQKDKRQYWQQLNEKMKIMNISNNQKQKIKQNILHKEAERNRGQRKKITVMDFESVKIIGKGAFGQVRLCRWLKNNEPVAVKKLKKSQMIFKNKVIQVRQQRNVLVNSQNNQWIVGLKCSFQDQDHLYLVMDYIPGGDLMNLLIKKDIFTHEQAKFYLAEMVLAIQSVHKLKYIHRDIKPDNILIDQRGHIKLSDFGLCKHTEKRSKKPLDNIRKKEDRYNGLNSQRSDNLDQKDSKHRRKLAYSAVGTPDYVAPQVQGKNGYTETVDWWSLGVIFFQMLVGYAPFASQNSSITWQKILNWRKYLVIPKQVYVSPQANDLIRKLINDHQIRLGVNGVQQIKSHPFFYGVDWNRIREKKAPNIPQLKNPFDTSNFDPFQQEQPWIQPTHTKNRINGKRATQFIGYTYKPQQDANSQLIKALVDLDNYRRPQQIHKNNIQSMGLDQTNFNKYKTNHVFKKQKQKVQTKLQISTTTTNLPSPKYLFAHKGWEGNLSYNTTNCINKAVSPNINQKIQKKSPSPLINRQKDDKKAISTFIPKRIADIRR